MNALLPSIHSIPVHQSNLLEDDHVVIFKEPPQVFMGPLVYLRSIWEFGGTINDYIEWRCAFYSRQIDKKYYLA